MNNKDVVKVSIEFADGTIATVYAATPEPVAPVVPAEPTPAEVPAAPEATATDTPVEPKPAV